MEEVVREGKLKLKAGLQLRLAGLGWKSETSRNPVKITDCMVGTVQQGAQLHCHRLTCALLLFERELEKQRENTASDILQKKQEAEAAVSTPLLLCTAQGPGQPPLDPSSPPC